MLQTLMEKVDSMKHQMGYVNRDIETYKRMKGNIRH